MDPYINEITISKYREQADDWRGLGARAREGAKPCRGAQANTGEFSHQEVRRAPISMAASDLDGDFAASDITGRFTPVAFISDHFDTHIHIIWRTHLRKLTPRALNRLIRKNTGLLRRSRTDVKTDHARPPAVSPRH